MKKSILLLLVLSLLAGLAGCGNDEENFGDIELNFKADFDNQPLVMYEKAYPYVEGMSVKFQLFQFYVSDVVLLKDESAEGKGEKIVDVDLISFKDVQTTEAAEKGISVIAKDVPAGIYKGIRFGIGVAPDLNSTTPGNYTPPHPLDDHYWSAAMGYVFAKIEGNADVDGDGQYTEKLTFHMGLNPLYRQKTIYTQIRIKEGAPLLLPFEVDLKKVFVASSDQFIDFRKVTQDHSNNLEIAGFIADNLEKAIVLK